MSGNAPESQSQPTLYDPPEHADEESSRGKEEVELELDLPKEVAVELSDVATHLGLSPAILASRAIEMICGSVGLVRDDELSSATLIQKYQTRLDLLHSLEYDQDPNARKEDENAYDWEDVDDIIGRVLSSIEE